MRALKVLIAGGGIGGLTAALCLAQCGCVVDVFEQAAPGSFDAFVLLDAQDWMDDATLNRLWRAITRAARPEARVIFRTAAEPSLLPGRLAPELLGQWDYAEAESREGTRHDRSAIYGGFHLYRLRDGAAS